MEGARKYGAGTATDRYHFNHEYGFGMVDAKAAVDIARGWTNVPPLESVSAASEAEVAIPPPSGSIPQTVTTTLTLDTGIRFTEFVEVNTDFEHTSFRDMDIELVSPSGAVSKLTVPFNTRHYTATYRRPDGTTYDDTYFVLLDGEFRFGSARHLGENPNGQWTLRLTDHFPELGGTLRSWSIKVYGHVSRPGAPTIATPITAGADSLTVAWSAPVDDGGPAITAYDLRYIQTSADGTVDANWTLVEDVWMGSGPLDYMITGLTRGTEYDVQVRAVSAAGDSPWSATAIGTPATRGGIRSFSPPSAALGGMVVVTISASGYGGYGQVVETLPPGFSYVSSSLTDDSVTVNGQEVTFILVGETDFTYRVTAPGAAGHYSFSGVLTNSDREEVPVGGALTITVEALPSVIVSRAAGGADTPVRPAAPVSLTATFSWPVSGFAINDINVGNGTVSNFAGTGAAYTFDVTPDDIGEVTVDIAAGVAQDADGNGNKAAARFSLGMTYDDDGDGVVGRGEAIAAIRDYFSGGLTRAQAIAVIRLYFSGAG